MPLASSLTTAVAVVGRREHSDSVLLMRPAEAFHDKLMGARNQAQPVGVVELLADILAEGVAGAARRDAPAAAVIRVRPEQIAHRPLVRHLQCNECVPLATQSLILLKMSRPNLHHSMWLIVRFGFYASHNRLFAQLFSSSCLY